MSLVWRIQLAERAELDLIDIARWTTENFGARQGDTYLETVSLALEALTDGPQIPGARVRVELGPSIHTLHIARGGRKGRHFIVFRPGKDRVVDVLRVLHDSMDLVRHLAGDHPSRH